MRSNLVIVTALLRRAVNEITRVPGAAIPGVLAPTIFMVGITSVFGKTGMIDGVTFRTFVVPVGLLQGAGFTGAATGVNLARDIEGGWFDRLLLCPAPRVTVLVGIVSSAALRALLPASFLLIVALILGVPFPGVDGVLIAALLVMGLASVMACYASTLALKFRTQQAATLMQVGSFIAVLFTPAYASRDDLTDWLRPVATVNPTSLVLEGVRQGFVGGVTWHHTWPALLALAGLLAAFGGLATRRLERFAD